MDLGGAELLRWVKQATLEEVRANVIGPEALMCRDALGRSLLFAAAMRGAAGIPAPPSGREPPQVAAAVCRHLVETVGIDVDDLQPAQHLSQSALFYAARVGFPEVVVALLEMRAELDRQDTNAQTPLFYAATGANAPVVHLLCERRANASHKDKYGQTAMLFAVKQQQLAPPAIHARRAACVRSLFQAPNGGGSDLVRTTYPRLNNQTALFLAVQALSLDVCAALLDCASEAVDDIDTNGQSALYFAAGKPRHEFVSLLLERSALATRQDKNGDTPLHYAARAEQVETCRLLMEVGRADAYAANCEMSTPASIVLGANLQHRKPDLVELFAGTGPEFNAQRKRVASTAAQALAAKRPRRGGGSFGSAPVASRGRGRGRHASVAAVPARGAEDDSGDDPACSSSAGAHGLAGSAQVPVSTALGVAEPSDGAPLGELARVALQASTAELERLLDAGGNPKELGPGGRNLLFFAAMRQASDDVVARDMCSILVKKHGVDLGCIDDARQTPLFHAARQGLSFTTDFLLEAQADPRHTDSEGWTALHFAAGLRMRGQTAAGMEVPRITSALIAARAEVNAVGGRLQSTPLELAAVYGRVTTLELLLANGANIGKALLQAGASCVHPLVRAGCDPNAPAPSAAGVVSGEVQRPLCMAVFCRQLEKVQRLLEARADVGGRETASGFSALHCAAMAVKGRTKEEKKAFEMILGVLLQGLGADPYLQDLHGKTAGDYAVKNRWFEGKRLLDGWARERSKRESEAFEERARTLVDAMRLFERKLADGLPAEEARQFLLSSCDDRREWGALVSQQNSLQTKSLTMNRGPGMSFATQQRDGWRSRHPAPLLLHSSAGRRATSEPLKLCKLLVEEARFEISMRDRATGETALFKAAAAGNTDVVSYLIEGRCEVNLVDVGGQSALFAAARAGKLETTQALLQARAAVTLRDGNGRTPLSHAAQCGVNEVVRELVMHRAEVNSTNDNGQSVLFFAIRETRAQTAKMLLAEFRARPPGPMDPTLRADSAGNSDLFHMAKERGLPEVVQLLEEARARQKDEAALLDLAGSGQPDGIVQLLAKGLDVNVAGLGGVRPLHRAAARLDGLALQCCRLLLAEEKMDSGVMDAKLETPLFAAARGGSEECIELLLKSRCDPNAANIDGETVMFIVVRNAQATVLSMLLAHGAKADPVNRINQTALFYVADAKCAEMLLDNSCDLSVCDTRRQTALFAASAAGHGDIVNLLLQRGAQADVRDVDGQSALHLAVGGQVPSLLVAAGAAVDAEDVRSHQTPLFHAVARCDAAAVSALLWAGADARRCDGQRLTALHHAAKAASLEVVSTLVREALPADSSVLDRARAVALAAKRTAPGDEVRGIVARYLAKVSKRYGEVSRRRYVKAGLNMRRRFVLAFEDPATKVRLSFGSPEYTAALQRLQDQCPWAFPSDALAATTSGPEPVGV